MGFFPPNRSAQKAPKPTFEGGRSLALQEEATATALLTSPRGELPDWRPEPGNTGKRSNRPGARPRACAAPRPPPGGRERTPLVTRERLGSGAAGSEDPPKLGARTQRRIPAAKSALAPCAPLGRPASGVLAAWVAAVRAVAWLLLGAATWLTRGPAAAFTAASSDAGIRATCSEITLRQEVLKDGFHRDLLIKVKFGEGIEDLQRCRLLIKQYIPTGLFVDPYELASLRERNVTEAMMVSENFDIEAPNYLSKESEVLVYARQDSQCIDCFQAFLPVHYRYHRPHSKDGETFTVVSNPDLLMYCDQEFPILKCWAHSEVAAPCALENEDICQWNKMKYKSVYKNVTLQVPVGLTIHTSLVCSVTLLITILCSTLILVTVFKYGHFSL
ncbi:phosphatidylinositol-glycan biosynthesis class X protein [Aotus nancymaae]|uniref:phosphatidylinositol-glycan biosynthesis class X protein n=1 Tax=Aotus nancymaae TaxID=37293 RepID=UPI0030FEB487